jgi:hypothetical protein
MATMRSVDVAWCDEFTEVTVKTWDEVWKAIGYLSTWGINSDRYGGKVNVYGDPDGNIAACYRNKEDTLTYSLFGLRGEDGTYTFHS